jgi:Putative phage tail protein
MGGLLNPPKPFLQLNAWQGHNLNALQYNTSIAGSVVALVFGTCRVGINLLAFGNYMGPGGSKKGKGVGPLPITGTDINTAKGGIGGGGGGMGGKKGVGKKSGNYSIDVDFGVCWGPNDIGPMNFAFAGGDAAYFMSIGLNLYSGADGQAPDPTFAGLGDVVGYSGLLHVTGTPLNLGQSPVLPNIQFEVSGFFSGTSGITNGVDANPSKVVAGFLTDPRYGAGYPAAYLDPNIDTVYGDYCLATGLVISVSMNGQTEAQESIGALAKMTNTAVCYSGTMLKFIPYGDVAVGGSGGVSWTPNLVPEYDLTDDHYLPWEPHLQDDGSPQEDKEDPIVVTRSSPADAINYMTIEYLDRSNFYNATTYAVFDQGSIDQFGTRDGENLQGHMFCNVTAAQNCAQVLMQRLQYIRNTFKFMIGWQFARLELMDILTLNESISGLTSFPVRITSIQENENGDLTIEAEEIQVLGNGSVRPPAPAPAQVVAWANSPGGGFGSTPPLGPAFISTTNGSPGPAGITTTVPTLLVAFIFSLQTSEVDPGQTQPIPYVVSVVGSTLGPLTVRYREYQNNTNAGLFPPGAGAMEIWFIEAPGNLTNEIITATYDSLGVAAGLMQVYAISNIDLTNPWATGATVSNQNPSGTGSLPVCPSLTTTGPTFAFAMLGTWNVGSYLTNYGTWGPIVGGGQAIGFAVQPFIGINMSDVVTILDTTSTPGPIYGVAPQTDITNTRVYWMMFADALRAL